MTYYVLAYARGWAICDVNPAVMGFSDEGWGTVKHGGSWMCGDDLGMHCATWCAIECGDAKRHAGDCRICCDRCVHSCCVIDCADVSH